MAKKEKLTIENGLLRLEEILDKMEETDTDLSQSFALYEEGMHLLKSVNEELDTVEKKVMMLSNSGELVEFDYDSNEAEEE